MVSKNPKSRKQRSNQPEPEVYVSTYFKDVAFEEDIEEALAKCVEVLGPIGKYEYGPGTHVSVVLATDKHGKLWYGDLSADDVSYRLEALRTMLGVNDLLAYNFVEDVSVPQQEQKKVL